MIEYLTVKKAIVPVTSNYCMKKCTFINKSKITSNHRFLHEDKLYDIDLLKSKFFYHILCQRKSERSYCEIYWQKSYDIEILHSDWAKIYNAKIWHIPTKGI